MNCGNNRPLRSPLSYFFCLGNISRTFLSLQAHATELIRFGSVHWCPVLPHVSEGREAAMSEADRARYRKARAAGIAQHGDNVMLDCFHPPPSLTHSPALPCSKLRWSLKESYG